MFSSSCLPFCILIAESSHFPFCITNIANGKISFKKAFNQNSFGVASMSPCPIDYSFLFLVGVFFLPFFFPFVFFAFRWQVCLILSSHLRLGRRQPQLIFSFHIFWSKHFSFPKGWKKLFPSSHPSQFIQSNLLHPFAVICRNDVVDFFLQNIIFVCSSSFSLFFLSLHPRVFLLKTSFYRNFWLRFNDSWKRLTGK